MNNNFWPIVLIIISILLKFNKFVERLRSKFSVLFDELMQRQLVLKGICSIDEWKEMKEYIHYDFLKDNNFTELKEAELISTRLQLMNQIDPYVGTYFSKAWVKKHVLQFDEEGIERMDAELAEEGAEAEKLDAAQMQQPGAPVGAPLGANAQPSAPTQTTDMNQAFNSEMTK